MNTFRPAHAAGALNVFRYQVRPLHWICSPRCPGVDQLSNVSVSLKVCGVETVDHAESSNPGASAPAGSAFRNFQSGLKLSVWRSLATAVASPKANRATRGSLMQPAMSRGQRRRSRPNLPVALNVILAMALG